MGAYPHHICYHRTTGIWQPEWLESVGAIHITNVRWTPDVDRGLLGMQVKLNARPARPLQLHVRLSLRGVVLSHDIATIERTEIRREIALEPAGMMMSRERVLWSPAYPNLIDAVLTLRDGEQIIDEAQSYVGLRSIGLANGRFLLNGRPYYLRLVLAQNYWSESYLASPDAVAFRREVELAKAFGFNGVRIHQKIEDPRFLYWCDRLGLLVWGEMANAYVFSPTAVGRLTREWIDMLDRDYSHPCIIMWASFNESWGVPSLEQDPAQQHYVRTLYHLTKTLDPTRPVMGNDGWEHLASDIWGIHDYALDGSTIRERYGAPEAVERTLYELQPHYRTIVLPEAHREGEPIMLTECGGVSYSPAPGQAWFGYGTVETPAAFLAKYEELIDAILDCPTIVGFCYTQLTDTEQETNGLLRADRTPKLDPDVVRAITTRPSRAMPSEVIINAETTGEVTAFQGGGS